MAPSRRTKRPLRDEVFAVQRAYGLDSPTAEALVALEYGLRADRSPWTLTELERLFFLRTLVRTGRIHE